MALEITGHEIVVPTLKGGLIVHMDKIAKVEARLHEVAFVTVQKAPELLATYNEAWLEISKHIVSLKGVRFEFDKLRRARKSILTLEIGPARLKELGLASAKAPAGNDDLREAILDGDEEYQKWEQQINEVDCVIELFKYKAESFYNAYTSVKKIIGADDGFAGSINNYNPNLSGGIPDRTPVGGNTTPVAEEIPGFGVARY